MTSEQRLQTLRERLTQTLSPTVLEILDESHLHLGHPGAKIGGGHFYIRIASPLFAGKKPLACHRLVYAAIGDLMGGEVHAARIECAL